MCSVCIGIYNGIIIIQLSFSSTGQEETPVKLAFLQLCTLLQKKGVESLSRMVNYILLNGAQNVHECF